MDRLFLAMPVTLFDYEALQSDFEDLIEGRWIPPQNLHLTLQFFAGMFEKEFLIEELSKLDLQAQSSELTGLGLLKNNKILYAGTENPSLTSLNEKIQNAFGLYDKHPFIPHITLMRIKKIHHYTLLEQKINAYEQKPLGRLHTEISLMQSLQTPEGVRYSCIKKFTS